MLNSDPNYGEFLRAFAMDTDLCEQNSEAIYWIFSTGKRLTLSTRPGQVGGQSSVGP